MPRGRWKKGESGNPRGGSLSWKVPPGRYTPSELKDTITKYLRMTKEEVMTYEHREDVPLLDMAIISILLASIKNNDMAKLDVLLNRVIGRPAQTPEEAWNAADEAKTILTPEEDLKRLELLQAKTQALIEARRGKDSSN